MRIATWNVNSVRTRLPRVLAFLARQDIDVLAMQEIKCRNDQFPTRAFLDAGYQVFVNGLNQWNGVAVAVRDGISAHEIGTEFIGEVPHPTYGTPPVLEPRALGVRAAGVEVWSLYVPNGRELDHPHFAYKLAWLDALRSYAAATLDANPEALALYLGDFNVAPRDEDVWDMAEFAGATHVSAAEREAFAALLDPTTWEQGVTLEKPQSGTGGTKPAGLMEVTRRYDPGWTYWDYQKARWRRNQGMKIDFALATPALARSVKNAQVDRAEREGDKPSDHAPVILDF